MIPKHGTVPRLIIPDNPVNQQIALKFIKALNFSVSAVWNGKEALDYLLKATSSDITPEEAKEHPIPSLILMDVQMPVLDGYHATHLLRHHEPFNSIEAIPRIPIVAMTASAIQGDREKCEKAGMDDYMAKPVKRSLLEKTITKWVSGGRNSQRPQQAESEGANLAKPQSGSWCTDHSSICSQNDGVLAEIYSRHAKPGVQAGAAIDDSQQEADEPGRVHARAVARRSSLSRAILAPEIPGNETENVRATRRAADQDQARNLRDAKLLSATDSEHWRPHVASMVRADGTVTPDTQAAVPIAGTSWMALTEANVSLLNHEQEGALPGSQTPFTSPDSPKLAYTLSDLPGPPPEAIHVAVDLAQIDAGQASSILQAAQLDRDSLGEDSGFEFLARPASQSRQDVGGLSASSRQTSTQSISTARPETR